VPGTLVFLEHHEGEIVRNALGVLSKAAGQIIEDEDTDDTVEKIVAWLDERKLI